MAESPLSYTETPSWNFVISFSKKFEIKVFDKTLGICRSAFSNSCFRKVGWRSGRLGYRHITAIHVVNAENIVDS